MRQPHRGGIDSPYKLVHSPADTELLADAYLAPVNVAPGKDEGELKLVEQTTAKRSLEISSTEAPLLLENFFYSSNRTLNR